MDNNYNNIITVKFAQAERPVFKENRGKNYVDFGLKNDYPKYLLDLYNESPKHGAAIKLKAKYIAGKGFEGLTQPANSTGESWNSILNKSILDDEIFDGYYFQVIYNLLGKVKDVFHIEFYKVRTNKDKSKFYVKNDWKNAQEEARCYDAFSLNDPSGSKILFIKHYNPAGEVYPIPSYYQALNYIESDVHVSRHILGIAKDSFVGTTLINMNGGEPQEEQKAAVEMGLKKKFTGSEGDRTVIVFNKSKDNAAEILPLGQTMLTKEDFTNINNLIQQEIFVGHNIAPVLMWVVKDGALGMRNEIRDAYEIFNNVYVSERQEAHEEVFNKLFAMVGIPEQHIKPVEPLKFEFGEAIMSQNLTQDEIREIMGREPLAGSTNTIVGGNAPVQPQANVNSNLAAMTGRQFQQLERIKRKFEAGKLTREQAAMMLKSSFGLTDEDVSVFLDANSNDEQFASQEEIDFALINEFKQCGEDKSLFEIISSKPAREEEYFADVKELSQLEANILNLVKKDPKVTATVMAGILKQDAKTIEAALKILEKAGKINSSIKKIGEDKVIERTITDVKVDAPKATTSSIFIRYSYEGPKDDKNREFCAQLLELDRLYSRSDIERMSERLGYSVWDRRGGWFTQPNGEARPYCRHQWNALRVVKKNNL